MQKKTLYERLLNSKVYGEVVSSATCNFYDSVRRDLTKREMLGEIYNKLDFWAENDCDEYYRKGVKLLQKYNYQHTGFDYLDTIDDEAYNPVFDGVNDDETDMLITRKIFIYYFEAVWQDNSGYPHNAQQLEEVWYLCMDILEDEGLKIDRDWKPSRAEKKKYIVPKEQEPERYFRLED